MYSATTHNVTVSVELSYLDNESTPEDNVYVWAYTVRIENKGGEALQLRSRHWTITDSYGRIQQVHGPGVVGEQPVIAPGASYQYTSGTPLSTPSGFMTGTYSMQATDGRIMDVEIPTFSLDTPGSSRQLH